MNLKKRLIIYNTITVVIPFIITIITSLVLSLIFSVAFRTNISYSSFKDFTRVRAELFNARLNIVNEGPGAAEDSEFHQYLLQRLSTIGGQIVITKNNKIIFSSKDINKIDLERTLEEAGSKSLQKEVNVNGIRHLVAVAPLEFLDGASGNAVLLAPMERHSDFLKWFIIIVIIVFIASYVMVNAVMSYQFSSRILKPVSNLKNAAAEITSGNLNCEISEDGDEEISELCRAFERMRIQLKDSVREKIKYDDNRKMLVSSISHDLKTPITSIKGYVEGILDGVANTTEKKERYLKTIYSKAETIDVMIDDLLLYSKLDLHQLPFNFEKTDICEFFKDCIYESAAELEKFNIKISMRNNLKESRYVRIDRDRMKRVIMNIIDNSRKYMDKKEGNIVITLRETNSSLIIELGDNGTGINGEDISRIFDRFYRADSARSEVKGSGLGLAIAKQIVEGHQGKIWAVNHEYEGMSIIISLAKGN
jgi:signal transduction histidine kinase